MRKLVLPYSHLSVLIVLILITITTVQSIRVQVNNIHHGYKLTIQGKGHISSIETIDNVQLEISHPTILLDQVQPELIPFVDRSHNQKITIDLSQQEIQYLDEEELVVGLIFTQHTSIVTTIMLDEGQERQQNTQEIFTVIKQKCNYSQDML